MLSQDSATDLSPLPQFGNLPLIPARPPLPERAVFAQCPPVPVGRRQTYQARGGMVRGRLIERVGYWRLHREFTAEKRLD